MSFVQKFHLYQFQQTDKRSTGGKKGAEDDDEMNFISMVEYQSLENNARKLHVATLQELREFWQGIRNQKTKEEMSTHLERISGMITQTKGLYSTLLSTSPPYLVNLIS